MECCPTKEKDMTWTEQAKQQAQDFIEAKKPLITDFIEAKTPLMSQLRTSTESLVHDSLSQAHSMAATWSAYVRATAQQHHPMLVIWLAISAALALVPVVLASAVLGFTVLVEAAIWAWVVGWIVAICAAMSAFWAGAAYVVGWKLGAVQYFRSHPITVPTVNMSNVNAAKNKVVAAAANKLKH